MTEILPVVNIEGNEVQLNQSAAEDLIEVGVRLQNAANADPDGVIHTGDAGFEELTDAQYFFTTSTQNFNSRGIYGNANMSDFLHGAEYNITKMHFDAMRTGVSAPHVGSFGAALQDAGERVMNAYTGTSGPDGETPDSGGADGDSVDIDNAEFSEIIAAFDDLDEITDPSQKSVALDDILDAILGLVDEDGDGGTSDDGGSDVPPIDNEIAPGDDVIGDDPVDFDGVWTDAGVAIVLGEFDQAKQALLDVAIAQYGEDFSTQIEGMSMNDLLASGDPFLKAAGGMESAKLDFVIRGGNLGDGAVDQGRQEVGDRVDEIILDIANDILNADGTEDITEIGQIVNDSPEELKASGDPILVALGELMDVSDNIDNGGLGERVSFPPDFGTTPLPEFRPTPQPDPLPDVIRLPDNMRPEPIFEQVTYSAEQLQDMMSVENGSFGLHEDGSLITVGLDKSDEFNAENGTLKINLEEGALRAGMVFQDLFTGESDGDETVTVQALDIDGNVLDEITVTGAESGEQFAEFDGGGVEIAALSIDAADDGFSDYSISGVAVMQEAEIVPNDPTSAIGAIDPNGSYQMDINDLIVLLRMLEQMNENVTTVGLSNQAETAAIDGMVNIGRDASNLLEAGFSGESVSGQDIISFALKAGELNDTAQAILANTDATSDSLGFADDIVNLATQATGIVIQAAQGANT
ncbi:hypothetical protein [Roseobacter weihaiensis]|uniref:hypothetical protein n=1 Tax=Roseobacter weihaiensis TaxID=2763262 RepID=UPI001D0A4279|nr:hypothetical protein [Roseobacter sp. H9]